MLYQLSYVRVRPMLARPLPQVDASRVPRKNRRMRVWVFRSIVLGCAGAFVAATVASAAMPRFVPLWQRVLQGGDLPGFIPQSAPPPLLSKAAFIRQSRESFVLLTPAAVSTQLTKDGFKHAVIENLAGRDMTSASSTVIQFGSPAQAQAFLKLVADDTVQPCPHTCNVNAFRFTVAGIPGAKGTRRVAFTSNGPNAPPFEHDFVLFTDGPIGYGIIENAQPNKVDRKALVAAAAKLYHRLHGSLPPPR
jgi:hypothetical protein